MKSDISLTREDIEGIRDFIKTGDYRDCPFQLLFYCCDKCIKLFPDELDDINRGWCPCDILGLKEVTKRAKQFIERWEMENGSG
jgi:hypothetical protein